MQRAQKRVPLHTRDRLFWIALAQCWSNWRTALVFVQPDTVVRWHRDWLRRRWTSRSRSRPAGRPPIDPQIRDLVQQMATANPLWGAPRIHGALQTLGIEVSERTVSRLLKPHTRPRSQTWKTFLTNHLASAAMDFFTVPTLTGRVLFVLVVLSHCRRRIVHFNVRASDSDVGGSTGRRGISGRDGAAMVASRSRQRLQRELPAASRGLGHRRGRLSRGEPLAESVRGTADRHNSPRVLGSHDRAQRAPSATRSHDLQPVLSSRPDASWAGERRPRQPADLTTIRVDRSSRFRKSADCITATNGG